MQQARPFFRKILHQVLTATKIISYIINFVLLFSFFNLFMYVFENVNQLVKEKRVQKNYSASSLSFSTLVIFSTTKFHQQFLNLHAAVVFVQRVNCHDTIFQSISNRSLNSLMKWYADHCVVGDILPWGHRQDTGRKVSSWHPRAGFLKNSYA